MEFNESNKSDVSSYRTTTVVTMFFDLKKLRDASPSTRPMDFYLEHCAGTLKLPYPMVIFCDDTVYDYLKVIRDTEVDTDTIPTQYIIRRLENYDFYQQYWDIIHNNRNRNDYPADSRNTASYFLLTMFKAMALWIARQRNFFKSPYYAWIDMGCSHICRNMRKYACKMLDNPRPKIAVCYIHYRSHEELSDMQQYMKHGGPCGIAATAFTLEEHYVYKFYTLMLSIFNEKLFLGLGHTEETVMVYCYDRHPELFTLFYGDYYSVFTNYHEPIEDIPAIVSFFIKPAFNAGRHDLVIHAAKTILDSVDKNNIMMDNELREQLTYKTVISARHILESSSVL